MIGSHLPDYVIPEDEDCVRQRICTPSNISPWRGGVSLRSGRTVSQGKKLREMGMDPETVDWMWVVVPAPDRETPPGYGRAVQHLWSPIIRAVGRRIEVLTPSGRVRAVYAGGRLSDPNKKRTFRGMMGRG